MAEEWSQGEVERPLKDTRKQEEHDEGGEDESGNVVVSRWWLSRHGICNEMSSLERVSVAKRHN